MELSSKMSRLLSIIEHKNINGRVENNLIWLTFYSVIVYHNGHDQSSNICAMLRGSFISAFEGRMNYLRL